MQKKTFNGDKGLANQIYEFKYMESTWVDGVELNESEKVWTSDNLYDYDRFKEVWEELEVSDSRYELIEQGSLREDGVVCMVLDYTLDTDQGQVIKFMRGISYKIA